MALVYLPAETGSESSGWTHSTGVRFTMTENIDKLGSYHSGTSQQSKVALYKLTSGTYDSGTATLQVESTFVSGQAAGWHFNDISTQELDSSEQYWLMRISDGDSSKALTSTASTGIQSGAINPDITWSTGFPTTVSTGTTGSTIYDYSTKFCQAVNDGGSVPGSGLLNPPPYSEVVF